MQPNPLNPLEVACSEKVGLPPSLKDVYEFREQYREQLNFTGNRFSESEALCNDNYPEEAYAVCINADVAKIQAWLLIPMSNIEKYGTDRWISEAATCLLD